MLQITDPKTFARTLWEEFQRIQFGDKRGIAPIFGNMQKEIIDLSVARNNEERRYFGDFLYADRDTTGVLYIAINGPTMPSFPFSASTGIRGFPYRTLSITNAAQAGKQIVIWYGYGASIIPPNQDIANISTIINPVPLDPTYARYFVFGDYDAQQSQAFVGFAASGPTAGQVSNCELWNPPGSGKILYCDRIGFLDITAADVIQLKQTVAAVLNNAATVGNKNFGGAAPTGQVRFSAGTAGNTLMQAHSSLLNQMPFMSPIRLIEGQGLNVANSTVNHQLTVNFEWREELN